MSEAATDILLRIRVDVTNVQAIATLGAALDKAQRSMANMRKANVEVGKSTGLVMGMYEKFSNRLNRVERSMDAVFRAGVHLQAMGRDLMGVFKKGIGIIQNATDAWGEYEYWLNRAAGASDVFDVSSKMYGQLSDGIQQVARNLGLFDPKQVAEGMYYWQSTTGEVIKSQKDLDTALAGVETAMQTAAMTGADYEQVMKGAYSISRQFQMPLSKIPEILQDLFLITTRTSLEYSDLIQSFKYTGPIAKMLGGSYKDVAKWLGIIGDLGQRGSMSGRGLGMMFTQLVRPSDKAKKAYNSLFKETMNVKNGYDKLVFPKGKFIGFEKWVSLLAKSTAGLTQKQKLQYLTTITGTQNSARIVLPLVDAQQRAIKKGSDIFKESKYDMANSAKVFKKAWDLLAGSWKGVTGRLKNSIMPVFLHLGKTIAKTVTPILDELADTLWDMKPAIEEATESIVKQFEPAIRTVGDMMKKALKWFKENPKMVKQIATWAALGVVVAGVAGSVMLAVGTLIFFANTIVLIIAGMLPMLAVIGAVIGAFVLFGTKVYQNVGGIRSAIGNLVDSLVAAFNRLFGGTEGVGKGLGGLWDTINKLIDGGLKVLADAINWLADALDKVQPEHVEIIKKVGAALIIMAGAYKLLGPLNSAIWGTTKAIQALTAMQAGITTFATTLPKMAGNIGGFVVALKGIGTAIGGLIGAMTPVGWVVTAIVAAIAAFVLAYETNFLGFKDFIDGLVQWFVTNVGPVIAGVFQWLQEVIPPILQTIADFVNNVLMPAFNGFVNWVIETFSPLIEQMGATFAAIGEYLSALGDIVTEVVNAIMEWFNSLGINVDTNFSGIEEIIAAAFEFIVGLFGKYIEILIVIWGEVWNFISTAVKNVVEAIVGILEGWFQVIEGIFEIFTGILTGDWQKVWDGIEDIVSGIVKVIESTISGFVGAIENIIRTGLGIIDGIFKTIFGEGEGSIYTSIKGFITTITDFAGNIISGFVEGIGDAIGPAIDTITGFFGDIIDGIKNFLGIKSPATIMLSIGKNIVAGLWNGINNAKDWIISKVTEFIKNVIPGPILDALGIHSPSRVMAAIGENIVKGLAVGIERSDDAAKAMTAQAQSITNAMSGIGGMAADIGGSLSMTSTSDATKEVNINVNVTSGDGSVSSLDMNTLASLITGSDMVRALEHMATVE